jgi:cytoskeletal protein RodZ
MSEHWNLQAVSDSKPEAPPAKPPEKPNGKPAGTPPGTPPEDAAATIPSVLSSEHSLGAIMTMAREARGFTREQAAKTSNIPGYYLTMIETDDYSSIADQLYLLPFLRRYAVFVALEPEEVASRFIRDVQRADMNPGRPSEPIAMFTPRKPLPWRIITRIAFAIMVVAGGWFGYRYYEARKSAPANSKAPVAVEEVAPQADQAAPKAADAAPANVAAPLAVPSTAMVPEAAPSSAAAPPAAVASAAVAPTAIPHSAASPLGKSPAKSAGHASARPRGPFKSAAAARRLSMQN